MELKKERIKESYINGIDSLEEYKVNKKMIEDEYNLLQESLSLIKSNTPDDEKSIKIQAENVYKLLINDNVDMEVKKIAIHKLINVIEVSPKTQEISIIYNL